MSIRAGVWIFFVDLIVDLLKCHLIPWETMVRQTRGWFSKGEKVAKQYDGMGQKLC